MFFVDTEVAREIEVASIFVRSFLFSSSLFRFVFWIGKYIRGFVFLSSRCGCFLFVILFVIAVSFILGICSVRSVCFDQRNEDISLFFSHIFTVDVNY